MRSGVGIFDGLSMSSTSPAVVRMRYCTEGAVMMSERLNSRSSRSCTISMCSMPRKPQRLERIAQPFVLGVLDRVEAGEHHGFGVAVTRERLLRRPQGIGDRLADL